MSEKTIAIPDSDQTARRKHNEEGGQDSVAETSEGQTSVKSGKHSSAEKLAASRPEFGSSPGNNPVSGASGENTKETDAGHEGQSSPRDKALRPKG